MNNKEELKSIAMCSPQRRNSCRFSDCLVIHVTIIWLLSLDHVETSRWSEKEIEIALQGEFALSFCCWGHVNLTYLIVVNSLQCRGHIRAS